MSCLRASSACQRCHALAVPTRARHVRLPRSRGIFTSAPTAPRPLPSLRPLHRVSALNDGTPQGGAPTPTPGPPRAQDQGTNMLSSLGLAAIYIGLLGYAFLLSPDQTPARDAYFLKKALNLVDDGYTLPTVWWSLFTIMGVYPAIYGFLLTPTGRSENKVPAWPFVAGSFFAGAFAIIPYFVFWQPERNPPPPKELSTVETAISWVVPAGLLLAAGGLWTNALLAGSAQWGEYFRLFDESKLTHVTTLDFCICTALAPFWMYHDAQVRGWEQRDKAIPILSCLPVVGPAVYLLLRPKNY